MLNRNLRQLVAALVSRIDAEQSTSRVRFGQIDALRCGVRQQTWTDLLGLLTHLGVQIERGQSGRSIRALSGGRGRGGALNATLATVLDNPLSHSQAPHSSDRSVVIRNRHEATITAALATKSPADIGSPSLSRSPALAELLTSFGMFMEPRAATGGSGGDVVLETLTISDLVSVYGNRIRRTLRRAETLGLVQIVRAGRSDGLVCMTDLGDVTLQRDHLAGAERMEHRAVQYEQAWSAYLQRVAQRSSCDRYIDDSTGEIVHTSPLTRAPLLSPSDLQAHRADGGARKLVAQRAICGDQSTSMTG